MTNLTGRSTISSWLANETGGPLLRGLLTNAGFDESVLAPIRDLPLQQLVVMTQGQLPQSVIDDLVAAANGGAAPTEEPDSEAAAIGASARFAGKTVIVTGAGSGVGRETAIRIVHEGGTVIGVDIAADRLDAVAASLPDGTFVPVAANITKQEDVDAIVAAAGAKIDGLANIAGINDDFSPAHETTDAVWNRVLAINTTGAFMLTRAVVPAMLDAGNGAIVNVASEAGLRGNASGTAYTVSKHAIVGLTRSVAFMYGDKGIRTNAVAPGGIATGMAPAPEALSAFGSARLDAFRSTMPPIAVPERIAAAITFLLSDDSANINGVVLPSDGGWSVQ